MAGRVGARMGGSIRGRMGGSIRVGVGVVAAATIAPRIPADLTECGEAVGFMAARPAAGLCYSVS